MYLITGASDDKENAEQGNTVVLNKRRESLDRRQADVLRHVRDLRHKITEDNRSEQSTLSSATRSVNSSVGWWGIARARLIFNKCLGFLRRNRLVKPNDFRWNSCIYYAIFHTMTKLYCKSAREECALCWKSNKILVIPISVDISLALANKYVE